MYIKVNENFLFAKSILSGNMFRYAVVCVALFTTAYSASLPSYIKPCKRSDPNINQCAIKASETIIPHLVKGDRSLKLRPLDPLLIPQIEMDATGNLKLLLTDVTLLGLGTLRVKTAKFDTDKQRIDLDLHGDGITVLGDYKIDGRILILPITGDGKINVTLVNPKIGYGFNYGLTKKEGKDYVSPKKPDVTLDYSRAYFDLTNLFNGDATLGPETNKFLNENWQEMGKELNPSVTETIAAIASEIVNSILTIVPYDEILLP